MPQPRIQTALVTSCMAPSPGISDHQSPTESTNSARVTTSAVRLAQDSRPSSTGTTPRRGSRSRTWRIHRPYPRDSRKVVIGSPQHGAEDPHGADEEEHHVHAHLPRLQQPEPTACEARDDGGAVDRDAVDGPLVHTPPQHGP